MKGALKQEGGFSLTEIMVALAIISLVGGAIAVGAVNQFKKARIQTAKMEIGALESAIEEFNRDCRRYPRAEEGLRALIEKPGDCSNWAPGGYLKKGKLGDDPWGNAYIYNTPPIYAQKGKFEIVTFGADGTEGGEEEDQDINSQTMDQ